MNAQRLETGFHGRERVLGSGILVVSGLVVPETLKPKHQNALAEQVFSKLEMNRGVMRQISDEQLRSNILAGDFAVSMEWTDGEPVFLAVAQSWPLETRMEIQEVGTVMRLNGSHPSGKGQAAEVTREATLLASMRTGVEDIEALSATENTGAQWLFTSTLAAPTKGERLSDYVFVDGDEAKGPVLMTVFDLNDLAQGVRRVA